MCLTAALVSYVFVLCFKNSVHKLKVVQEQQNQTVLLSHSFKLKNRFCVNGSPDFLYYSKHKRGMCEEYAGYSFKYNENQQGLGLSNSKMAKKSTTEVL